MLFELFLGRPCFPGRTKEEVLSSIVERGVSVQELARVNLPQRLYKVVEKATTFVPEHRYNSAVDMARHLQGWLYHQAPKVMTRVASLFLTLHHISKSPAQNIDKPTEGVSLAGSPLSPDAPPTSSNALVPASKLPAVEMLVPADIEAMAERPEFAALFGAR